MTTTVLVHKSEITAETLVLFGFKGASLQSLLPDYVAKSQLCIDESIVFKGEQNERKMIVVRNNKIKRVLVIGLGSKSDVSLISFKNVCAEIYKLIQKENYQSVALHCSSVTIKGSAIEEVYAVAAECAPLALYSFRRFKTLEEKKTKYLSRIELIVAEKGSKRLIVEAVQRASLIANSIVHARDLINEPANYLTPKDFVKRIQQRAREVKLTVDVLDEKELKQKKMGGILAVASGSVNKPALLVLKHKGSGKNKKTVCLVGKGVCFDSGGLSLKPAKSMMSMKYDMAGGAACAEAVIAAHRLNVKHDVIGLVPLVENAPDGKAYRPGDVLTMYSGSTVEVFNTDAEGRLILADALSYAKKYNPDIVCDLATLTGAAKICLGDKAAAIMGNDQQLINTLIAIGEKKGERLWQLPLWDEYLDDLKSDIADCKNISLKGAGTITAGKFLSQFIPKAKWAHIDIAAVAWEEEGKAYTPKGGSGFGVCLLVSYLLSL